MREYTYQGLRLMESRDPVLKEYQADAIYRKKREGITMAKLHIISKVGMEYDHAAGTETTTFRAVWDDKYNTETLVKHVVSCTFDSDDSDEMTSVGEDFWLIPYNVDDPDGDWRDIREGNEIGDAIEIVE